jgi:hypothetical protein
MSCKDSKCKSVQEKNAEFDNLLVAEHPIDPQYVDIVFEAAKADDRDRVNKVIRTIVSMQRMNTATAVRNYLDAQYAAYKAEQEKQQAAMRAAMAKKMEVEDYPRGTRVICIKQQRKDGTLEVYGEGVYEGNLPCAITGMKNPFIRLDNGKPMWGCICWWAPVAEFNASKEAACVQVQVTEDGLPEPGEASTAPEPHPATSGGAIEPQLQEELDELLRG